MHKTMPNRFIDSDLMELNTYPDPNWLLSERPGAFLEQQKEDPKEIDYKFNKVSWPPPPGASSAHGPGPDHPGDVLLDSLQLPL